MTRTSTLTPNSKRYLKLVKDVNRISLTRALQYEIIESYPFKGKVLDYGGGDKSLYNDILKCDFYSSVNVDSKIEPTWIIKVGDPNTL